MFDFLPHQHNLIPVFHRLPICKCLLLQLLSMFHHLNDSVSDPLPFSLSLGTNMLAPQQIIVKPAHLIDGPQRGGGHVELDHFVQHLGVDSLVLDVGIPAAPGLFHREGDVVPEPDVLSVVQASAGAVRPVPDGARLRRRLGGV